MKKWIEKTMKVETICCDICGEEMPEHQFNENRIEIVRHLFNTKDFDAHEKCINGVVREAFSKYFS